MHRRAAVIIWVLFFMALVWCIAMGGACVAWFIVVYAKDPPFWAFPFFAAILFALPTLRAGLPGAPPYGSLVDWAAFYWGIAILAGALIALLTVWNIEARVKVREQRRARRSARVMKRRGGDDERVRHTLFALPHQDAAGDAAQRSVSSRLTRFGATPNRSATRAAASRRVAPAASSERSAATSASSSTSGGGAAPSTTTTYSPRGRPRRSGAIASSRCRARSPRAAS